jgi:hypothetical protein
MADKRHTIRYELPAEDVQLLSTPNAASIPTWGIGDAEKPESAADAGYEKGHVYELIGRDVEVGGKSQTLPFKCLGQEERE